jgi:hypothetical protein
MVTSVVTLSQRAKGLAPAGTTPRCHSHMSEERDVRAKEILRLLASPQNDRPGRKVGAEEILRLLTSPQNDRADEGTA